MQIRLDKITFLNNAISSYLVKINNQDLAEGQSREIFTLVSVINYINLIKNGINLRFSGLLENKEKNVQDLSDQAKDELVKYHRKMLKQIRRLARFFEKYDRIKIEKIITKGKKYKALEEKYRIENIKRKGDVSDNPIENNQFYSDLMDMLKEISIFIELIASSLLDLESIEENSTG
jgi:Na+/phosphate symporter